MEALDAINACRAFVARKSNVQNFEIVWDGSCDGWARLRVMARDDAIDVAICFMRRVDRGWRVALFGTAFMPQDLAAIPVGLH